MPSSFPHPRPRTLAAAIAALATAAAVHAQTPPLPHYLYTDASALPGGDGSDWLHAFRDLQDALAAVPASAAADGHLYEIRIAQGIYRPDRGTHDRTASFVVGSAVSLAGGFGGLLSPNPDQQSSVFVSVLSGDLLANDGPNFANTSDNSHHVVTLLSPNPYTSETNSSPRSRLTSLTIRAGNAMDAPFADGAGVLASTSSVDLYITGCTFRNNNASNGGAMSLYGWGKCFLYDCDFESNKAFNYGGALYASIVSLDIFQSTFSGNTAMQGGALRADNAAITRSTFSSNSAEQGGGLYLSGRATVSGSWIVGNTATTAGGGAFLTNASILSCLVAHNSAPSGGAFSISYNAAADIANCTIVRNTSTQTASALLLGNSALSTRISNSILWNNPVPSNKSISAPLAPISIDHCILQNGASAVNSPQARLDTILTTDPRFADPVGTSTAPTAWADKDYRLTSLSPAIDAGLDATPALRSLYYDLANANRLNNSTCAAYARPDLGAYEFTGYICPSPRPTTFVRAAAAAGGDGSSWAAAFRDLQDALATPGVRDIWIAEGTYSPDRSTGDRSTRFRIEKPFVSLYGSFAGTESSPAQRTIAAHLTILSADLLHNDSQIPSSTLDNASGIMRVETDYSLPTSFQLSGLTFASAKAVTPDEHDEAALYLIVNQSSISDCTFRDNSNSTPNFAQYDHRGGAAIYTSYTDTLDLNRCSFFGNSSGRDGGALWAYSISFTATDCTFIGNTASNGGAAHIEGGFPTLRRCSFISNAAIGIAYVQGGALYTTNRTTLDSCRFLGNLAFAYPDPNAPSILVTGGGASFGSNDSSLVVNSLFAGNRCAGTNARAAALDIGYAATMTSCTFANNAAAPTLSGPGTASTVFSSNGIAANCIFWNTPAFGAGRQSSFGDSYSIPQLLSCIVQGGAFYGDASTIDRDPSFTNPAGPDGIIGTSDDDYSLRPDSPAIDAADSSRLPAGTTLDLAGHPRFVDARNVPNTGAGTPNYLDIGALEFTDPHACTADFNNSGTVSTQDIFDYLSAWFAGDPRADINGNGLATSDILDFLTAWFTGC